jgi:hypothetical protein
MRRYLLVLLISILVQGFPPSIPIAAAGEVTSVIKYSDGTWAVDWTFTIKHPDTVNCDWGKDSPTSSGVKCEFPIIYSIDYQKNNSGKSAYPFLDSKDWVHSPICRQLTLVGNGGENLDPIINWNEMNAKRNTETKLDLGFTFKGAMRAKITIGKCIASELINLNVTSPGVNLTGLTLTEAQSAYRSAQDKANADAKAAAEAQAKKDAQAAASKLLTIKCVKKGKNSKLVTGESPKCPKGYTNPIGKYETFQAYQICKLFKKDNFLNYASLQDGGKTLTFSSVGKYSYSDYNMAVFSDLECALQVMSAPSFVKRQIEVTRAIDGVQKADWGLISAFWTYHPQDGLNISLTTSR